MPTYTDATAVKELIAIPFTSPSDTRIGVIIDGVEAHIHLLLKRQGATVPLTDTTAVALLGRMAAMGAAVEVWSIAFVGDDDDRVKIWRDAYNDFLDDLRRQRIMLGNPTQDQINVIYPQRYGTGDSGSEYS